MAKKTKKKQKSAGKKAAVKQKKAKTVSVQSPELPEEPGQETENIYDDSQRDEQMQEDEISPQEAGFMEGYEHPKNASDEIKKNLRKKKDSKNLE